MPHMISESQSQLATRIASTVSPPEREALSRWIEDLLEIRSSDLPTMQKAKQALLATSSSNVIVPTVKIIGREVKRHVWDDRSVKARLGVSASAVGVAVFGGQAAGVAALGGAIGVPLWVVFGAGAVFVGVLYEELTGEKPKLRTRYREIDAEKD